MVPHRSLVLPMILFMIIMQTSIYGVWKNENHPDFLDMENMNIPWPLIYSMGKRSLSGTQDWGKRAAPARPLRLGKRNFQIRKMNPAFRDTLQSLKPHTMFVF